MLQQRKMRRGLVGGLLVLGVIGSIGSAEDEAPTLVRPGQDGGGDAGGETGGGGETPAAPAQTFVVGDVVALGDFQIVVHGVTDPLPPTPDGFLAPGDGRRWVAVDVEITNTSAEAESISTLMQFEVQDSTNAAYDIAFTDHNFPNLDGEAAPGGSRRGTMVFDVPADATGLRLNFSGAFFGTGSATIQLS